MTDQTSNQKCASISAEQHFNVSRAGECCRMPAANVLGQTAAGR